MRIFLRIQGQFFSSRSDPQHGPLVNLVVDIAFIHAIAAEKAGHDMDSFYVTSLLAILLIMCAWVVVWFS
jgi:hypothetical protein